MRFDICDICHPDGIRNIDFKLPIQSGVSDHSRLSTVPFKATLVANLRRNTCQNCQTCRPVLTVNLTRITQIIHCPAVVCRAVNDNDAICDIHRPCDYRSLLAAVSPSVADHLVHAGLTVV